MTALCGGGASSARPGFGLTASIGIAQAAALLNNIPTSVAFAIAGVLGFLGYELATFCNTDPPAMPVPTATDYANALGLNGVAAQLAGIKVFNDLFGNLVWPTFCQCDTGTTPARPALPTPPANIPSVNPNVIPAGPVNGLCWDYAETFSFNDGATGVVQNLSHHYIPTGGASIVVNMTANGFGSPTCYPIPTGATSATVLETISESLGTGINIYFVFATAAGAYNGFTTIDAGTTGFHTVAIPTAGSAYWAVVSPGNNHTANVCTIQNEMQISCSSSAAIASPCCPPDPSLTALLQNVQQMVEAVYTAVGVPLHSYADGVAHPGLSGSGTITLAAAAPAIRVNLTTDSAQLGETAGDPTYLFDRGFIVPIVNGAPIRNDVRLVYNPQMYLLPSLTEQIGYSFHPGITATITELTAGP